MKVPNTFKNMGFCICYKGTCPTYYRNNLSGGLFCSIATCGASLERTGCSCNNCELWMEYGLTELYFCAEGAEER